MHKKLLLLLTLILTACSNFAAGKDWPQAHPEWIGDYKPIVFVTAPYPKQAYSNHQEGFVRLTFDVNAEGSVQNVAVAESSSDVFESIAVSALSKAKYLPPSRFNLEAPVAELTVIYHFKL
ncbi:energy transducer TonB [Halioxenophilus sp. WMMB6]|uniref:energy transducer TonB n=1 Tax=Halioxenophilus sp. WMMB6 TaxID=3073815 RepID=UPI00295F4122|nr:energy transducer TonB [Halioxenophilus sp. WMMB6]